MKTLYDLQHKMNFSAWLGLGIGVAGALTIMLAPLAKADRPLALANSPLTLSVAYAPPKDMGAVPPGEFPSNILYTFSSSGGPFCIEGFSVHVLAGSGYAGMVLFSLSRIDDFGVSHPTIELLDGVTQGTSPQDVVLSYGNQICASSSVEFRATQFAALLEPAADVSLIGTAIISAAADNLITIE